MIGSFASKLSDAQNPGTVSVVWAALLAVVLVLLVWRALLPLLRRRRRTSSRHARAMMAWRQKDREGDPPGR
jgi:flagellar biosynthesis/type III secretory pathway M-ring protein FliF/YscJ